MSDSWFKRKFEWLESIAEDPTLPRLALAIAVKLAWRYLNAETQDAWPSVATLAERLNTTPRSVQRALDKLVAAGKLGFEGGGGGPGDTNHYRMVENSVEGEVRATLNRSEKGDVHVTLNSEKGDAQVRKGWRAGPKRVTPRSEKGWRARHPSQVRDQGRQAERESAPLRGDSLSLPRRRILSPELPEDDDGNGTATQQQPGGDGTARQPSDTARQGGQQPGSTATQRQSERVVQFRPRPANPGKTQRDATRHQTRRVKGKPFPDGWVCGNAELAIAQTVAGWDLPKAVEQFDGFRDRVADEGWTSCNWAAAWTTWCRRGRDYEAKHPQKAGVFDYGREWAAAQKRTEH